MELDISPSAVLMGYFFIFIFVNYIMHNVDDCVHAEAWFSSIVSTLFRYYIVHQPTISLSTKLQSIKQPHTHTQRERERERLTHSSLNPTIPLAVGAAAFLPPGLSFSGT
jgi:hypothetical protein